MSILKMEKVSNEADSIYASESSDCSKRLLALGDVSGSGLDPQYHHLMHKVQLVSTAARPQTFCL